VINPKNKHEPHLQLTINPKNKHEPHLQLTINPKNKHEPLLQLMINPKNKHEPHVFNFGVNRELEVRQVLLWLMKLSGR
jgi:hypothetical protein